MYQFFKFIAGNLVIAGGIIIAGIDPIVGSAVVALCLWAAIDLLAIIEASKGE